MLQSSDFYFLCLTSDMKTSINNLSDDIDPMLNKVDDINKMVSQF